MRRGRTRQRLIAIGDIHGHVKALRGIVDQIQPTPADSIVILGDCVNRGPDSREVLDCLMELQQSCNLISILGNHEEMMLEGRNDPSALGRWMTQGGDSTLKSYGEPQDVTNVPKAHWDFLSRFVPYYETDEFIFTHANYCWYNPMDKQESSLLRWYSLENQQPKAHISGKKVLLGHTPGPVRDAGHYCCIDTGCGLGGVLTAMEVHIGEYWHATETGEVTRTEDLKSF